MEILQNLAATMTEIKKRKEIVTKELKALPIGKLQHSKSGKQDVIYQATLIDKYRKRITITHDNQIQADLARRFALEEELRQIKQYENILKSAYNQLVTTGEIDSYAFLLKKLPWLDKKIIRQACIRNRINDAWATAEYEQFNKYSEQKVHLTSAGLYVRSKSEVLISEELYKYELPFHYEEILYIGSQILVPDFTIKRADGKLFYWEHEGRTDNRKYIERQQQKHAAYASVGIVPWDNLIVTYDTEAGTIDTRIIESEIKNKLLL